MQGVDDDIRSQKSNVGIERHFIKRYLVNPSSTSSSFECHHFQFSNPLAHFPCPQKLFHAKNCFDFRLIRYVKGDEYSLAIFGLLYAKENNVTYEMPNDDDDNVMQVTYFYDGK